MIIGAGGHARETLGVFLDLREKGERWDVLGFVDDNPATHGQMLDGKPVLGSLDWLNHVDKSEVQVICAIGNSAKRFQVVQRAADLGLRFCNAISPHAIISPFSVIAGKGVMIGAACIINTNVIIHEHSILNVGCTVSHDSILESFCTLAPGVHICGNVRAGGGSDFGSGAVVTQGLSVGKWSIVGAGCVAVDDIPANVTVVGVPARIVREREGGWHLEG